MSEDIEQLVHVATMRSARSIRAAARLMTLIENSPDRIPQLLGVSATWPSPRIVLGITGPPGSGKSLLVDRLIAGLRRRRPESRIGVIAVDPSSPYSGGALLGDRVRMMRHADDPMVFIRSAATRGRLGGLMLGALGFVRIMGLIGSDIVLIETVGVGQGEVEITKIADLVMVVFAPDQGDSIQVLKAGLMEVGDIFIVNKAEKPEAGRRYAQLRALISFRDTAQGARLAEVYLVSALEERGIGDLIEKIEHRYRRDRAFWAARRKTAIEDEIRRAILEEIHCRCVEALSFEDVERVLCGEVKIADVVKELLLKIATADLQ